MPAPVIIVHDQDDVRAAALNALRAAGHECASFADPMAALDAVDGNSRLRVLVTRVDFGPGKLNGVALARMLLMRRSSAKAIFVARAENERHAIDVGTFLPTPLDPPALVEAVWRALAENE